jgi:hypothetical protein
MSAQLKRTIMANPEIDELNRLLDEHSQDLLKSSLEYPRLAADAVNKRNAYDVSKAKATLRVATAHAGDKGWTVDRREAQVLLECEPQMIEARIAEAHAESMKVRLKAVADSLSAVQTRCRLLKTESDLNGYR